MIEAYRTWLDHKNELQMGTKRMFAPTECTPVAVARDHLWQGATVVVAAADLPTLRVVLMWDTGPASLNEVVNEHYPEDWE